MYTVPLPAVQQIFSRPELGIGVQFQEKMIACCAILETRIPMSYGTRTK
jgi:hypothetical protein